MPAPDPVPYLCMQVKSTIVRQADLAGASVLIVKLGLPELTQPGAALHAVCVACVGKGRAAAGPA